MQKLIVESLLPVEPTVAWDVFESDAFRDRLSRETNLHSEVISDRDEGQVNIRELRFTSGRELPTLLAKALGTPHLSYLQTNRFDRAASRLDWQVVIPQLSERVRVEGVTTIEAHAGGCRRVVDGCIEVRLRLIGGQVEKLVANEFQKSMERAVDLARSMLPTV